MNNKELLKFTGALLVAQMVKNLPAMQETQVWSLGREEPLKKEMATHSSILAWRIPLAEEPGRLKSRVITKNGTWLSNFHFTSFLKFTYILLKFFFHCNSLSLSQWESTCMMLMKVCREKIQIHIKYNHLCWSEMQRQQQEPVTHRHYQVERTEKKDT